MMSGWYNFKTREHDYFAGLPPEEHFKDYIPQFDAAQNLFDLYVHHMEKSQIEAMEAVLKACADIE